MVRGASDERVPGSSGAPVLAGKVAVIIGGRPQARYSGLNSLVTQEM
jgi:hypothetical protein